MKFYKNSPRIYKKLFKAKKEMEAISKDSTNPFFNSNYFDINKILSEIEPILQKHDLLLLQPIEAEWVRTKIYDIEDGDSVVSEIHLGTNTDPQKLGSKITYYRRYTLQSLLGLQAEDDDANMASTIQKKDKNMASVIQKKDKKLLNNTSKDGKVTKEWENLEIAIEQGTVTDISQVREFYKVSKGAEASILKLFK